MNFESTPPGRAGVSIRILGNPPIHSLTVKVLEDYRQTRRSEKVGPATINKELATIKHALTKPVAWKWVRKDIRQDLKDVQQEKEPPGRLRYLEDEAEAQKIIQHCRGSFKALVSTTLYTGMRRGEVLSLTWDQVDLKQGVMRLTHTKNGEARDIPINETVRVVLAGLRVRIDVPWVFLDEEGNNKSLIPGNGLNGLVRKLRWMIFISMTCGISSRPGWS